MIADLSIQETPIGATKGVSFSAFRKSARSSAMNLGVKASVKADAIGIAAAVGLALFVVRSALSVWGVFL